MQITANKKSLVNKLTVIKKIAGKKSNLHITQNVLITIGNGRVMFQATDLENGYVSVMGENPYKLYDVPGETVLTPVANLLKAVKAVPKKQETVSLEVVTENGGPPYLLVNGTISIVACGNPDDFPELPKFPHKSLAYPKYWDQDNTRGYDILTKNNLSQVSGVNGAADEKRAYITGMFFDFENMNLVSTDGNRLHVSDMPNNNGLPYDENILVPKSFIGLLLDAKLKNQIGNFTYDGNRYVFVEIDNGYVYTRILEGEYPDYVEFMKDIDRTDNILAVSDKAELVETIKEANAITNQEYKGIVINLNAKCQITSVNPEIGEFKKLVKDFTYAGDDLKICLTPEHLLHAFECTNDKGANVYFRSEDHSVFITSADETFTAAVMPRCM